MKVQADTVNGVYTTVDFDGRATVVDGDEFLSRLRTLGKDEILASDLTPKEAQRVDDEYGIG